MKARTGKPPPLLTSVLAGMWLLLEQTLALGQIVLAALLAIGLARAASILRPLQPRLRRARTVPVLSFVVLADIVRSNVHVARIVLGLVRDRAVRSGFLDIPLELRDPHGLAALAVIVTSTPGTVWVDLSPEGDRLTLHVLDLGDEAEWIRMFRVRYERPLMRIFE